MFRDYVQRTAMRLGLSGSTRNLPGGESVEVEAEGDPAALEQLLGCLRAGPSRARVDAVDVTWHQPAGLTGPFEVGW